jgi:CubicO group peptidase (beta-lactamase class C family)
VDTRALAAATGFAGTAPDLCRYLSAHVVGSGLLLSDASKREMQRVHWHARYPDRGRHDDYGLGFILEQVGDRHTFGHSGGFPGHITRSLADPADGLVVSALTNCIDGPAADIAKAVVGVIDVFQAADGTPSDELLRLEGRYADLWSVRDLVAPGAALLVGSPDSWAPLADPDRLEALDPTTLRISETSSYGSKGELVRVHLDGTEVGSLTWAGATAWPESRWPEAERRLLDRSP